MPSPPWSQAEGVDAVVDHWQRSNWVRPCVTADETLAEKQPSYAEFPRGLHANLIAALRSREVKNLYSHQHRAFEAASRGEHVVVATPTASGKSFCFHLPVLNTLLEEPDARALYLFPTKALSRDQEVNLRALMTDAGVRSSAIVYDGDTPGDARRAARERAGVI
jgi:DEAD/DEAH box helicase domain-containing protein